MRVMRGTQSFLVARLAWRQASAHRRRRCDRNRALTSAVRRRDNGHWEPPGGVLELAETIHAGLAREVREETGLEVEPEALTGIYKNMRRGIIALVFRCRIVGGEPGATTEAREVAWLTPAEVQERMDEAYATRLLDALQPGPAAIRAHDGLSLLPT